MFIFHVGFILQYTMFNEMAKLQFFPFHGQQRNLKKT